MRKIFDFLSIILFLILLAFLTASAPKINLSKTIYNTAVENIQTSLSEDELGELANQFAAIFNYSDFDDFIIGTSNISDKMIVTKPFSEKTNLVAKALKYRSFLEMYSKSMKFYNENHRLPKEVNINRVYYLKGEKIYHTDACPHLDKNPGIVYFYSDAYKAVLNDMHPCTTCAP